MDGHALELEDDSFDVAGSQFGVMLFPDASRAMREMARVIKPGGRALISAYGDPHQIEFLGFFVTAVQSVRPEFTGPPLDPPPLEFQLADPNTLRTKLVGAGLRDVTVETIIENRDLSAPQARVTVGTVRSGRSALAGTPSASAGGARLPAAPRRPR